MSTKQPAEPVTMKTKNIAQHTPGPWKAHINVFTAVVAGHIIKVDEDVAQPICLVPEGGGSKGKPEQIANARLIAAAPELLEACLAVIACQDAGFIEEVAINEARAAIAKATGI